MAKGFGNSKLLAGTVLAIGLMAAAPAPAGATITLENLLVSSATSGTTLASVSDLSAEQPSLSVRGLTVRKAGGNQQDY